MRQRTLSDKRNLSTSLLLSCVNGLSLQVRGLLQTLSLVIAEPKRSPVGAKLANDDVCTSHRVYDDARSRNNGGDIRLRWRTRSRASDKADANGGNVLTDALSRAIGEDILVIVLVRADTGVCMVKKKEKTSRQPPCVPCSSDAQRMDNITMPPWINIRVRPFF